MSRKYRHQGYQDNDRDDRKPRGPQQPRQKLSMEERIQKKSLRHATDPAANEVIRCHQCGCNVQNFGKIGPETTCPHCRARLHCCRTCRQFDSAVRWQCRAEIKQAVGDKNKANDCGHYSPRIVLDATGRRSGNAVAASSGDPKQQFESLFKR